ncbi:acyl-CoA thioesterase [Glutamicibacter sp. MNS18]|uniref:acyl-CoA thioesterase n=1 Tax=Glutamicibacter sp. MNS18 TaxID=2989817 RepID=UPI002236A152|nr:thioesterase family protein [Glutamicibacter sp. MNS18]MCW4465300.1 acyl-CoA thioesterase [Glutamicibacter sp. MNS18]
MMAEPGSNETTAEPAEIAELVAEFLAGGTAGTQVERTIEWVDTDAAGHQHNSVIMRFVEAAEARLFRKAGLNSYFAIAPRVRHEADFRAKLYFGQDVTTAVRVDAVGSSSMSFSFRVWGHPFKERGVVLAAEGKFVTVCVPHGAESSAPWPEEIRSHLASTAAT